MAKSLRQRIKESGVKGSFKEEQATFSPANRIPSRRALLAEAGSLTGQRQLANRLSQPAAFAAVKKAQRDRRKNIKARAARAAKAAKGGRGARKP